MKTQNNKKINEWMETLHDQMNDYAKEFARYSEDYGEGYICDAMNEYADANTDIYYNDIAEYIKTHIWEVNDAIIEYGGISKNFDLWEAGQAAQFDEICGYLRENKINIKRYRILQTIQNAGVEELTEEQAARVEEVATNWQLETFEELTEAAEEITNTNQPTARQTK